MYFCILIYHCSRGKNPEDTCCFHLIQLSNARIDVRIRVSQKLDTVVNGQSRDIDNKGPTRHKTKIIEKETNTQKTTKTSNNKENNRKELADNHHITHIVR